MMTEQEIRDGYRIATRGSKFRIEQLKKYRFLWWKWEVWEPAYHDQARFDSVNEAADRIDHLVQAQLEIQEAWRVVE